MGAREYNQNGNDMKICANGAVGIRLDSTSRISLRNSDSGTDDTVDGKGAGEAVASGEGSRNHCDTEGRQSDAGPLHAENDIHGRSENI